ncbi:MAG: hypothetical protein Q8M90_12390 [Brevundimonas sp.]|nr:hypothetical protein [Brevundimonas sp.]MDZ4062037.1 hypothetical protein [Brevundimonas sp.]
MNHWLKGFLRIVCRLVLFGGPLLALVAFAGSFVVGSQNIGHGAAGLGLGLTLGLYILLWSLLVGGVLSLLLSIDDRLERLEAKG